VTTFWVVAAALVGLAPIAAGFADRPRHTGGGEAQPGAPAMYGYRVVNTFPHDAQAFTQGLIYRDGFLYESTGLNGRSSLRKVKLETGEVVQREAVDAKYFAEGLTEWGGRLLQLTYQTGVGFVYDFATFKPERSFRYAGEGWGLTHDRTRLIMSDGSPTLRFLDPGTFQETGRLLVKDRGTPVQNLNELEYVQDEIFANVWHADRIARIDPASGRVTGWIDLTGLLSVMYSRDAEAVLNGIAYDTAGDRLFVTGKLWPKLFEIKLERR
jgi:glutaminyl-peptide cyclotransferase